MPPKKKPKTAPAREQSLENDNSTSTSSVAAAEPVISDGWTDEQETTLFKAISVYKLKPAGIHKHFQMLAISELMKNHGVSDQNTTIPGIWSKLRTLYNLEGLDEREDMEEDGSEASFREFKLPEAEFAHLMDQRKFRKEGDGNASPPSSKENSPLGSRSGSAELTEPADGSDDEDLTPPPSPTLDRPIRGRGRGRGRARAARGGRRGRRSKAADPDPEPEDEDEDEDSDDADEGETEDNAEETVDDTEEDDEDDSDQEETAEDDATEEEEADKERTPKKRRGRSATASARGGKADNTRPRRGRPPKAESVRRSKRNK